MFQNKKLKRNATSAIAEVAEVALCASNCALPTSGYNECNHFSYNISICVRCPYILFRIPSPGETVCTAYEN